MLTEEEVFPLPLRADYRGSGKWELMQPFEYINPPDYYKVPIGFISDGASIPRFAWTIIGAPWSGRYTKASVIHDYLCETHLIPRKKADKVFLDGMKILKVHWFKRWLMYRAVRIASFF